MQITIILKFYRINLFENQKKKIYFYSLVGIENKNKIKQKIIEI